MFAVFRLFDALQFKKATWYLTPFSTAASAKYICRGCVCRRADVHKQLYQSTYHCLTSTPSTSGAGRISAFIWHHWLELIVFRIVSRRWFLSSSVFLIVVTVTTNEGAWRWGRRRPPSHDRFHLSRWQQVLFLHCYMILLLFITAPQVYYHGLIIFFRGWVYQTLIRCLYTPVLFYHITECKNQDVMAGG